MFIDIHTHVRVFEEPTQVGDYASLFPTPEELRDKLTPLGVRAAVILPCVNPECIWVIQSVQQALLAHERCPDFIIPFMNVDPRQNSNNASANLSHQIEFYKERGCRGVGEVCANLPFNDPMMENLFAHVQANDLPMIFHVAPKQGDYYGIVDDLGLPLLGGALRKFPDLKFLGHSQPFWAEISGDLTEPERNGYPTGRVAAGGAVVRLMRECPNLYGDLSAGSGYNAVSRDPDFGYGFLTEFQDRLLFGTDVCDLRNETPLPGFLNEAVEKGCISREVYEKVGWRNAERVLGLEP